MHPDSLTPRCDDARSPQISEVTADLRLVSLEDLDEKTNANFLIAN